MRVGLDEIEKPHDLRGVDEAITRALKLFDLIIPPTLNIGGWLSDATAISSANSLALKSNAATTANPAFRITRTSHAHRLLLC